MAHKICPKCSGYMNKSERYIPGQPLKGPPIWYCDNCGNEIDRRVLAKPTTITKAQERRIEWLKREYLSYNAHGNESEWEIKSFEQEYEPKYSEVKVVIKVGMKGDDTEVRPGFVRGTYILRRTLIARIGPKGGIYTFSDKGNKKIVGRHVIYEGF